MNIMRLKSLLITLGFIFSFNTTFAEDCINYMSTPGYFKHASYDRAEQLKTSIIEMATRIEPLLNWRGDIRIENLVTEMRTLSALANVIA